MTRTLRHRLAAIPMGDSLVERRRRLSEAVEGLATAIASGDLTPSIVELQALAQICDDHQLKPEARRIRRWIGENLRDAWLRHPSRLVRQDDVE